MGLRRATKSSLAALVQYGKASIKGASPKAATHQAEEEGGSGATDNEKEETWLFGLKRDMDVAPAPPPLPFIRLKQIANDACDSALATVTSYDHPRTDTWNTNIINTILKTLISETSPNATTPPSFKFAVNSTIIQHQASSSSKSTGTLSPTSPSDAATLGVGTGGSGTGRRGMHSATGAYWNNEKDGMWSFKYEAGEGKGLDVVVSVIWIAI